MLTTSVRVGYLQKKGNAPEEYEDAYSEPGAHRRPGLPFRFALADGATEGAFSGIWAGILTRVFCRVGSGHLPTLISRAEEGWQRWQSEYLRWRASHGQPLRWYEEPGLAAGAFSTLLGLEFTRTGTDAQLKWSAVAVGDSCLFLLHEDNLSLCFPINSSALLNDSPFLIASNSARNDRLLENCRVLQGTATAGDRFFLMTDALAGWFLRETEAGESPWPELEQVLREPGTNAFEEWIGSLRDSGKLRNDDVTVLMIELFSRGDSNAVAPRL